MLRLKHLIFFPRIQGAAMTQAARPMFFQEVTNIDRIFNVFCLTFVKHLLVKLKNTFCKTNSIMEETVLEFSLDVIAKNDRKQRDRLSI